MVDKSNRNVVSIRSCSFAEYQKKPILYFDKSINQILCKSSIGLNG